MFIQFQIQETKYSFVPAVSCFKNCLKTRIGLEFKKMIEAGTFLFDRIRQFGKTPIGLAYHNATVLRNQLTISGEKPAESGEVKAENFHRSERASGRFVRTFTLPTEVDDKKVSAEYRSGILTITLPKAEAAKPKKITVSVA